MNYLIISFILSAVIATISMFANYSEKDKQNSMYLLKIFAISFTVIYIGLIYFIKQETSPDIQIGEADF